MAGIVRTDEGNVVLDIITRETREIWQAAEC
jgi:hypothetical protein